MIALPGGSKLFTLDLGNCGVIAQYQSQKTRIRTLLQKMVVAGQRALGLVLQCAPGPCNDGLTLPSDDYSWFSNAASLIQDARSIGFQFIAPEFVYVMGDDALRNWTSFDPSAAARIWNLLAHFRDQVMVPCGLPFRIDLGGEWPTPNGKPENFAVQLARYVWTNYTAVYWPGGVPCQDATISIPGTPESVALLLPAFDGNPPACLDIHLYDGNGVYPDARSAIWGLRFELAKVGLDRLPWDIGETLFNDAACAQATALGITQSRLSVQRIYQWQVTRGTPEQDSVSVADVSPYDAWRAVGA